MALSAGISARSIPIETGPLISSSVLMLPPKGDLPIAGAQLDGLVGEALCAEDAFQRDRFERCQDDEVLVLVEGRHRGHDQVERLVTCGDERTGVDGGHDNPPAANDHDCCSCSVCY